MNKHGKNNVWILILIWVVGHCYICDALCLSVWSYLGGWILLTNIFYLSYYMNCFNFNFGCWMIVLINEITILLNSDVECGVICSIMFSIFYFGWCLLWSYICLFASYVFDTSIWVKIKCKIFFIKKNVKLLHMWKVWADVKSDTFTYVKMSRHM
jgi:hypothetical protein